MRPSANDTHTARKEKGKEKRYGAAKRERERGTQQKKETSRHNPKGTQTALSKAICAPTSRKCCTYAVCLALRDFANSATHMRHIMLCLSIFMSFFSFLVAISGCFLCVSSYFACFFCGFHSMKIVDLSEGENANGKNSQQTPRITFEECGWNFAYFNRNFFFASPHC